MKLYRYEYSVTSAKETKRELIKKGFISTYKKVVIKNNPERVKKGLMIHKETMYKVYIQ